MYAEDNDIVTITNGIHALSAFKTQLENQQKSQSLQHSDNSFVGQICQNVEKIILLINNAEEYLEKGKEKEEERQNVVTDNILEGNTNNHLLKLIKCMYQHEAYYANDKNNTTTTNINSGTNMTLIDQVEYITEQLSYVDLETSDSILDKFKLVCKLETEINNLEKMLSIKNLKDHIYMDEKSIHFHQKKLQCLKNKYQLLHGKLYLVLHYTRWISRLIENLDIERDRLWMLSDKDGEVNEGKELKKAQEKSREILQELKSRVEMKIIWDDRKAKGFTQEFQNCKWSSYKICVDGGFKSKLEMLDATKRDLKTRKEYTRAQKFFEELRRNYRREFPKGTPFVCACHYDARLNDVEIFVKYHNILNDEKISLCQMINQVGRTINGLPSDLHSPLMISVHCEQRKVVQFLLCLSDIDLSVTNAAGINAFHYAALNERSVDILKMLLNHKSTTAAIINHEDNHGNTPLDYVYAINHSYIKDKIVNLLITFGGIAKNFKM
eukprot:g7932.t1